MALVKLLDLAEHCSNVVDCEEHTHFVSLVNVINTMEDSGEDEALIIQSVWPFFMEHMDDIVQDEWGFLKNMTTSPYGTKGLAMLYIAFHRNM
jgi:hypothetical protein